MQRQHNAQQLSLPEQWKQLKTSIQKDLEKCDDLINYTSTSEDSLQQEISTMQETLGILLNYLEQLKALSASLDQAKLNPKKKNQALKEIRKTKPLVNKIYTQLTAIYVEKLICKIDISTHPDNRSEQKKLIHDAFNVTLCLIKLSTVNPAYSNVQMDKLMDLVIDRFHFYFDINPEDPISPLLKQALKSNDVLESYTAFQQALDLAAANNNYFLQYRIAYEQSANVSRLFNEQGSACIKQIDHALRIKYSKMIYDPLVSAAQLTFNKKIPLPSSMESAATCHILHKAVEFFLCAASQKEYLQDFDKRDALLKEAHHYFMHAANLARFTNVPVIGTGQRNLEITTKIRELEQERKLSVQKKLDEEKMEEDLKIYHQKYFELVKECDDAASKKRMNKTKNHSKKSQKPVSPVMEPRKTASSSSSEEENDNTIITGEPDKTFNLDQHLEHLHEAESTHDVLQQVSLNFDISNHYRLIAMKHIHKNHVEASITTLQQTLDYLTKTADLIREIKTKNNVADHDDFNKIDEWTQDLAKETRKSLDIMIKQQTKIQEELEKSREKAKNDIINNLGERAWFKNGKSGLSPEAVQLKSTRGNVAILNEMCVKLDDVYDCLEISVKETKATPQNNSQVTLFRRRSFHDLPRDAGVERVRRMSV